MSDSVKWIKLSVDLFNDEKIRLIRSLPDSDFVLNFWIFLLTLAGKRNDVGLIYIERNMPYTPQMLATLIGKSSEQVVFASGVLAQYKMIEVFEGGLIKIVNWEKHQNIDGLDKVREQNRLRKQNQRAREQLALQQFNSSDSSRDSSRDVTQQNKNKEIDIKNKKEEDIYKGKTSRFSAPTITDIKSYFINDKGINEADADYFATRFINFYESKNWMVGKNKMTNWKTAATRSLEWEDKRQKSTPNTSKYENVNNAFRNYAGTKESDF
jgi:phage replisome organizer, putative, N-terminal region